MEKKQGKIISVNISDKKGVSKRPVPGAVLIKDFGMEGDAHSGSVRQVSLMGWEDVEIWKNKKAKSIEIKPGDFAENITTAGIDWSNVKIGDEIIIGGKIKLKITRIGKECHSNCKIKDLVGDCIMPKKGIFANVVEGGKIQQGDSIELLPCTTAGEEN